MKRIGKHGVHKSLSVLFAGLFVTAFVVGPLATYAEAKKQKYKEIDVSNGGTLKGVAKWKGDVPKLPPVRVFKHQDICGEEAFNPALIVDPSTKGVKFVAVYLENVTEGKSLPPKTKKLKSNDPRVYHAGRDPEIRPDGMLCNFEEHVFAFARKRSIGLLNLEDILHNPHGFGMNGATRFNTPLPDRNRMTVKKLRQVKGLTRVQCDAHVHMNAWMFGFNHPYFAVTDSKGNFEITDIPPGKYTVVGWHEGYNIKEFGSDSRPIYDEPHVIKQEIEIKGGDTVELNLEYPVRDVKVEYKVAVRSGEGH